MIVEQLSPQSHAAWDAYVEAHPRGNLYHLRAWAEVAARAYGHRAPFLLARDAAGGPIRGALPLFVIASPVSRYLTSAMFGGYGAILADTDEARRALITSAIDRARAERASRLVIKAIDEASCPAGFTREDLGAVAKLSLAGGPDALWKRFRDKTRNAIRKGQKSGLELRAGREELPHFYEVLAHSYHRKGTPIYGDAVMRALMDARSRDTEIVTLRRGAKAISGALVAYHKTTVYVPFCASRAEHFSLNPNNLIYWEIMRRAGDRGMTELDFGRSPVGSSSLAFKLGWGAIEAPEPHFIHALAGAHHHVRADDPWAARAIALWRALPRPLADRLGPWVHGRFFV